MMLLEMASGGFGERTALGDGRTGLTYSALFDRAARAATLFEKEAVQRVGFIDVNSEALPIALYGSAWAGLPFAPLNYRLDQEHLEVLAHELAPALVICEPSVIDRLHAGEGLRLVSRHDFLSGLDDHEPADHDWSMDPEEIAVLLFTSGTSGPPKAAVLRHRHLVSYVLASVEFMGAGEDEATLVSVPPYHVAGMAAILSATYAGRRIVQLPGFDAGEWVELVREQGVTHAMVVPTMLARIVERLEADRGALGTLRALSYGGGRMPLSVIERAVRLLPQVDFVNAYGLTETSSTIALLGPDDHREALAADDEAGRRRLVSVGRPLPAVDLEIRDETGEALPPGSYGEIHVRGEQVSGEYLGRPAAVDAEGWFATRDSGMLDEEGFLFLEGRIDDVIIRGGENLSPGEIEDCLVAHGEVVDAAAVGLADTQWGEVVAAIVVRVPGSAVSGEELQRWVRERLRSAKVPARVEFRDELPYNETGKLLRRVLKAELAAGAT
ncbi:MAG: 2-succinylbenzoate--CoA ligase [Acidimicrobiales bacterium]|nr:2-succinylbenzoate--CoA ligase [Acidimicrobiales bacterium]